MAAKGIILHFGLHIKVKIDFATVTCHVVHNIPLVLLSTHMYMYVSVCEIAICYGLCEDLCGLCNNHLLCVRSIPRHTAYRSIGIWSATPSSGMWHQLDGNITLFQCYISCRLYVNLAVPSRAYSTCSRSNDSNWILVLDHNLLLTACDSVHSEYGPAHEVRTERGRSNAW